jgi:hypothetical protein
VGSEPAATAGIAERLSQGVPFLRIPIHARDQGQPKYKQMKKLTDKAKESGALGWGLLWLLGIPIPVLLILFLLRGCT